MKRIIQWYKNRHLRKLWRLQVKAIRLHEDPLRDEEVRIKGMPLAMVFGKSLSLENDKNCTLAFDTFPRPNPKYRFALDWDRDVIHPKDHSIVVLPRT